jgi:hypothetical protein
LQGGGGGEADQAGQLDVRAVAGPPTAVAGLAAAGLLWGTTVPQSKLALLVGATPVLVAIVAALRHREVARPVAWLGFGVSLLFPASFTVAQARLLPRPRPGGRDRGPVLRGRAGRPARRRRHRGRAGPPPVALFAYDQARVPAGIALSSLPLLGSPSRPTEHCHRAVLVRALGAGE